MPVARICDQPGASLTVHSRRRLDEGQRSNLRRATETVMGLRKYSDKAAQASVGLNSRFYGRASALLTLARRAKTVVERKALRAQSPPSRSVPPPHADGKS